MKTLTHTTQTYAAHLSVRQPFATIVAVAFALAAAVSATQAAPPARTESSIFFDWGSNETVNDSGREVVSFDKKARTGELIVSFGDRRVYYVTAPGQALSYPIAIPRDKSKWSGLTSVSEKRVNPSWTPTPEMIAENPRLPPWVPGGHPMNPLGTHALYLGSSAYRIHGTDAPWTIGTAASKGCVRMYNKDVQDLYPRVAIGTRVTVTYSTYKFDPLDSESAKGVLAGLDKGRKVKPEEDVAGVAASNAKKWRGEGSGDEATVQKASANKAAEEEDKDIADKSDLDREKVTTVKAVGEDTDFYRNGGHQKNSDKSVKSADEPSDSAGDAERSRDRKKSDPEKQSVETGSVDKPDARVNYDSADAKQKELKEKLASKEKLETPSTKKGSSNDDDSAAVAKRALAAAERAAAAAERAAEAAERASAAVIKATATAASESKSAEPKATEAEPMKEWPVVR